MFLLSRLAARGPQLLTTLLVFSLSAGVLGGILFFMDAAGPHVFEDITGDVDVDMEILFTTPFYAQNETSMEEIEQMVSEQEAVLGQETIAVVDSYDWRSYEDERYRRNTYLGVNQSFFATFNQAIELDDGAPGLTNDTCYVEHATLNHMGLEIGDNYTISMWTWDENGTEIWTNHSLRIASTFVSHIFFEQIIWNQPEDTTLRLITTRQGINDGFGYLGYSGWDAIEEKIWVELDHTAVIGSDPAQALENLDNLRKTIENRALPFVRIGRFGLLNGVYEYTMWSTSMRVIALAFSIPSIVMGIMLIQYNSNLLADERRKDIGMLKTRGASGWQAFTWVLSSAIITGIIGSFGAVLTGALAALLSSTVRTLMVFDLTQLADLTILLQPTAVVLVFMFSFVVGLIVALPAAVRALLMTPTEAHSVIEREVLAEAEELGNPVIELLALAMSGYVLMPLLLMMSFGGFYIASYMAYMLIAAPLLGIFTIALARLMSRPTARIKAGLLGKMEKSRLTVGVRLMSRTVRLFKKSEAMGTMFIAMVFAAGIFASISATTGYNHMTDLYMFQDGADVVIDVKTGLENVTLDMLENISSIEGVEHSSAALEFNAYAAYYYSTPWSGREYANQSINVIAVQPEEWVQSAFMLPYFTLYNTPQVSIPLLSADNTDVVTSFKPISHYVTSFLGMPIPVYSDQITLSIRGPAWNNVTDCTIVDVMASSDQGATTYLPGEPMANNFIVIDLDYAHSCLNTTHVTKFFIKLQDGYNYTKAVSDLHALSPNSFGSVKTPLDDIDEALDSKAAQSLYGVYTLNVLFTLIYLTAGMTIVAAVRVRRMRKQLSILRALGEQSSDIALAVLADTTLGVLIGAGVGAVIGLALTALVINMPLAYIGMASTLSWARLPVILGVPWLLLTAILSASFLFALAATYVVTRRNLKLNIASEIQYAE
jgi:ABC-type lipoprotein release transport system permease subunit